MSLETQFLFYKTMVRKIKSFLIRVLAIIHADSSAKVVFYHDISKKYTPMGTEANVFWAHMTCLREGDIVCFDDGFRGLWDEREKLRVVSLAFGVKIIVFLAVGLVGKPGYLTWVEIRELQDKYRVEFQCHTWSHQTLAGPYNYEVREPINGRTEEWYRYELVDSKAELERQLGKNVTSLCFPVGYFSDDVIRRCKNAGYQKVYASYPGNVTDEYIQPRCLVQDFQLSTFKAVLRGGMCLFAPHYRQLHEFN